MKNDTPAFLPPRRAVSEEAQEAPVPPRAAEEDFPIQFTTRISPALRRALNELSAREERPISELLPELLEEGLKQPLTAPPAPSLPAASPDRQADAYMALITINTEARGAAPPTASRRAEQNVQLSVRLLRSYRARINRRAKEEGISAQQLVERVMRRALERRGFRF